MFDSIKKLCILKSLLANDFFEIEMRKDIFSRESQRIAGLRESRSDRGSARLVATRLGHRIRQTGRVRCMGMQQN